MRKIAAILAGYVLLMAIACDRPTPSEPGLTPEQSNAAREVIVEWLECEECREGQLKAVVELGQVAVPSLAAALNRGPAPASSEFVRRRLEQAYRDMLAYEETHPEAKVQWSAEEYVEKYLGNYDAMYRTRAATALGRIGGREARKALEDSAGQGEVREDVRLAVDAALSQQP